MHEFWRPDGPDLVVHADNLAVLPLLPDGSFEVIYLDPPFNTGRTRTHRPVRTVRSPDGDRTGFGGHTYATIREAATSYDDAFADYWAFLGPRLEHARRLLSASGTLYLHLDHREVHYAKVLLDQLFGRENFLNEIVWAYDFGGRPRDRWPAKHDTILVYCSDIGRHHFDAAEVEREPYMAPGLVSPEKAERGKLPTDVWWHTIVGTTSHERTGYPTQKPVGILRRVVAASSRPGDWVLDYFAGSGSLGAAARDLGRRFVLVDSSPDAVSTMRRRFSSAGDAVSYVDAAGWSASPISSTSRPCTPEERDRTGSCSPPE